MSTELTTEQSAAETLALLTENNRSKYGDDKALSQVTSASSFLPYIQIMQAQAQEVLQRKISSGVFALCKGKEKIDLGENLLCVILGWRPKAMAYSPEVISCYNPESEQFKKIQAECELPNSGKGCGPEFLLYLPDRQELCTFFFGNATGRMEAPNLIAAMKKGEIYAKIECKLITDKLKRSWFGPKHNKYDVALALPSATILAPVLEKFNNPPETSGEEKEKAEASEERG